MTYKIALVCSLCDGTGEVEVDGQNEPCVSCGGDGKLGEGTIEGATEIADLADKVDDCLVKLDDIKEKLAE